jgi:integrase
LADARKQAALWTADRRAGVDPAVAVAATKLAHDRARADAEAEQQRLGARPKVKALFEDWHRREVSKNRRDGGAEIRRAFEKDVLPLIGDLFAEEVRRQHVMRVFDTVKDRGVTRYANQLLQYLRQMFGYGALRDIVQGDPTTGLKKKHVGGAEGERLRHLSEEEICELMKQLPTSGLSIQAEAAVLIMLSTCCRVGEVSRARWSDVDLKSGVWCIPADHSKNGREHLIHLSAFAKALFNVIQALGSSKVWLFPSRNGKTHISTKSLQKQFRDRQREKELKGRSKQKASLRLTGGEWCAHDLRRTGATLMGELGIRSDVIERCLNHVGEDRLKKIYQRQELMPERMDAFHKLGECLEQLSKRKGVEVSANQSPDENPPVWQSGSSLGHGEAEVSESNPLGVM